MHDKDQSGEQLKKNMRNETEQLKALLDTVSDLSGKLQLDKLLASVLERAVNLLSVTGGELAIYDPENKVLKIVASHNIGMDSIGTILKHGEGAMGSVAETRKSLMIPDYQKWASRSFKYNETVARCVMVVPLLSGGQLVGAIAAVHLDKKRQFNEADLELLGMFAPLAATAIENARIYEAEKRRADEQKALLDTMSDLSNNLELNTLLTSVLQRAVKLLDVTGGELAIYDEGQKELTVVASHNLGMNSAGTRLKIGEGAMGRVAKTKQPLNILDYQTWEGRSDKYTHATVRSILVVPLLIGNQLVGTIAAVHLEEERRFSNHDLELLFMFSPLAATAIENARLFDKTKILLREAEQRADELNRTKDQLVQQEKLASLGQLTAGIAHEIKNPLNFVNNFSEVSIEIIDEIREAYDSLSPDSQAKIDAMAASTNSTFNIQNSKLNLDDIKSNLAKIHEHGTRADSIVKSMLEHSRGGTGKPEPTDLNSLVKEYVNLSFHGMRASKNPINVDMEFELDEKIDEVPLIAEDFSRVIINLSNNAFDAMRDKLSAMDEKNYSPKLVIRTLKKDEVTVIEIADNGSGISEDIKDKILQPFFTTKKGTEGTGLGLSITNDIIKAHGGFLEVSTIQNEGTSFTIKLSQGG